MAGVFHYRMWALGCLMVPCPRKWREYGPGVGGFAGCAVASKNSLGTVSCRRELRCPSLRDKLVGSNEGPHPDLPRHQTKKPVMKPGSFVWRWGRDALRCARDSLGVALRVERGSHPDLPQHQTKKPGIKPGSFVWRWGRDELAALTGLRRLAPAPARTGALIQIYPATI